MSIAANEKPAHQAERIDYEGLWRRQIAVALFWKNGKELADSQTAEQLDKLIAERQELGREASEHTRTRARANSLEAQLMACGAERDEARRQVALLTEQKAEIVKHARSADALVAKQGAELQAVREATVVLRGQLERSIVECQRLNAREARRIQKPRRKR